MRKIIPAVVAGAAVLATAGTAYGYVTLDKDVQLSVDGVPSQISTMTGTVGQMLQSKGIELGEHDVVAPAPDTELRDGTKITVQYGRQIRVTIDGQQQTFWTTATRVDEALGSLDVDAEGAKLSTSRSTPIGRSGLSFNLATKKTITIDDAGRAKRLDTTAQTVGAALADAKIELDDDDLLSVSEDTALRDGSTFTVTKVDVKKVIKKQKVKYQIRYVDTDQLEKGRTEVETRGEPGVREIEITEVRHNGSLQSREQTESRLATPPRTEVVLRGTKEPEPEPADDATDEPADTAEQDTDPADPGPDSAAPDDTGTRTDDAAPRTDENADEDATDDTGTPDAVWDRLAQCESGQRWDTDTGNGYYGGVQFSGQTWRAYGGTDFTELASQATREQQIQIAEKVLDDVGWKAWPACSRKLGLR